MSRRLRTTEVRQLLTSVEAHLASLRQGGYAKVVDGKPLVVGTHSKDPDAQWGRAGSGYAKGYKMHAIYAAGVIPEQWDVTAMNTAEQDVAARLIPRLKRGGGYILGDKIYDSNRLHSIANDCGYQLLAQQKQPGIGLGHHRHSPGRLRCIQLLKTKFGREVYAHRNEIERRFGWLTNHATGLMPLPSWARREHRVRLWVQAKLLIHAVYAYLIHPPPTPACA
jgi:hypothetical protein